MWNLVSDIKVGGFQNSAEENIWTKEGWKDERVEKTAQRGAARLELSSRGEVGGACSENGEKRTANRLLWQSQKERDD
jgi:hypothetical protein